MFSYVYTARTLLAYLVISLIFVDSFIWLLPLSESVIYGLNIFDSVICTLLVVSLFFVRDGNYAFYVWYSIDVTICSIAHGTVNRTISGWTGEHATKSKRYMYQAKLIDYFAFVFGDGWSHCERAYIWEKSKGYV